MFWDNFIKMCNERNEKPNPVAKKLGITSGTVTNWKNGSTPQSTTLKKIADYFNVDPEYLLTGSNTKKQTEESQKLSEQEKTLLESFRSTTELGRQRIIQAVLNICDEIEKKDQSADTSSAG